LAKSEIRISKSLAQTDPIGTGITLMGVAPGRAETNSNIKCPNDKNKTILAT
jgi:NAD(P)-dependent dehydrogenase (short-subunit alcohol dehydrogenase family)